MTLLQAGASQFLWFSSNPGISKENPSHKFTVQKYLLPANNIRPNNYEESYAVIKPFLINTISFHACLHDSVLFTGANSYQYSCIDKCPSVGPSGTQVRTFLVSTFLYLMLGPCFARCYGTAPSPWSSPATTNWCHGRYRCPAIPSLANLLCWTTNTSPSVITW